MKKFSNCNISPKENQALTGLNLDLRVGSAMKIVYITDIELQINEMNERCDHRSYEAI